MPRMYTTWGTCRKNKIRVSLRLYSAFLMSHKQIDFSLEALNNVAQILLRSVLKTMPPPNMPATVMKLLTDKVAMPLSP